MDTEKVQNKRKGSDFEQVKNEFKKFPPTKLEKSERIEKRRFSLTNPPADAAGATGKEIPPGPASKVTDEAPPPEGTAEGKDEETAPVPVVKKVSELSAFDDDLLELDSFLLNKYHRKGYMCTPKEYYKILIFLGGLQILGILACFLTLILSHFYYPGSTLIEHFQPANKVFGYYISVFIFILVFLQPLYSGILFFVCLRKSKKRAIVIRTYYVFAAWLILVSLIALILVITFASHITRRLVRIELEREMICYDDEHSSTRLLDDPDAPKIDKSCRTAWDEIQTFYECCGINSYKNWYKVRGFWDPGDNKFYDDWKIPHSCCKSQVKQDLEMCTREPEKYIEYIHTKTCLNSVVYLMVALAVTYAMIIFANFFVQVITIIVATKYHEILRFEDGTFYKMSAKIFFYELFYIHKCKKVKFAASRTHYSQILPINATADEIEETRKKQKHIEELLRKEEEERHRLHLIEIEKEKERKRAKAEHDLKKHKKDAEDHQHHVPGGGGREHVLKTPPKQPPHHYPKMHPDPHQDTNTGKHNV